MNTKSEVYNKINQEVKERIENETNLVANLANTASLIKMNLENVGWVGFFLVENDELVLGPFQGKPAAPRIPFGKGVCGTAVVSKEVQLVIDVKDYPGHLACDASSNSELCIPIFVEEKVVAVIDLDSPLVGRFDEEDLKGLSQIIETLKASGNFKH